MSNAQITSLCKFNKNVILELAVDLNLTFENICTYLMFWCTKISMRKMSVIINKKLSTISDTIKKVRYALFTNKAKKYFEEFLTKEFINQNTTRHSRKMLNILEDGTIMLVVDGTLLQTQTPSKLFFLCLQN